MAGYYTIYPRDTVYPGDKGALGSPSPPRHARGPNPVWHPAGQQQPRSMSAGTHTRMQQAHDDFTRSRTHGSAPRSGRARSAPGASRRMKGPAPIRGIHMRGSMPMERGGEYTSPRHAKQLSPARITDSPAPTQAQALRQAWPLAAYTMQRHPLRTIRSPARDGTPRRAQSAEVGQRRLERRVFSRQQTLQDMERGQPGGPTPGSAEWEKERQRRENQRPRQFLGKLKVASHLYQLMLGDAETLSLDQAVAACGSAAVRNELVRIGAAQRETVIADVEYFQGLLCQVHQTFPELHDIRTPNPDVFVTTLSWTDVSEIVQACRSLAGYGLPKNPAKALKVRPIPEKHHRKTPEELACDEVDAKKEAEYERIRLARVEAGGDPEHPDGDLTAKEKEAYLGYLKSRETKQPPPRLASFDPDEEDDDDDAIPGMNSTWGDASGLHSPMSPTVSMRAGTHFPQRAEDIAKREERKAREKKEKDAKEAPQRQRSHTSMPAPGGPRSRRPKVEEADFTIQVQKHSDETLGLDLNKDLRVCGIVVASPAARCGVPQKCVGMRLVRINGTAVFSVAKAIYLSAAARLQLDFVHTDESRKAEEVAKSAEGKADKEAPKKPAPKKQDSTIPLTDTITHHVNKLPGKLLGIDFDHKLKVLAVGGGSGLPDSVVGLRLFQVNGALVSTVAEASKQLEQTGTLELMFVPIDNTFIEMDSPLEAPTSPLRRTYSREDVMVPGSPRAMDNRELDAVTHRMTKEPRQKELLGIELSREGVVIRVVHDGPAAKSGLNNNVVGMRLLRVNGQMMGSSTNIRTYVDLLPFGSEMVLGFQYHTEVRYGESPMNEVPKPPPGSLGVLETGAPSPRNVGVMMMGVNRVAYLRTINTDNAQWVESLREERGRRRAATPGRTEFSHNRFAQNAELHKRPAAKSPPPDPEMERAKQMREKQRAALLKRRQQDVKQAQSDVLKDHGAVTPREKSDMMSRLSVPLKRETEPRPDPELKAVPTISDRLTSQRKRGRGASVKTATIDRLAEPKGGAPSGAASRRSGSQTSSAAPRRGRSTSTGPRNKPKPKPTDARSTVAPQSSGRGSSQAAVKGNQPPPTMDMPEVEAWGGDDGKDETAAGQKQRRRGMSKARREAKKEASAPTLNSTNLTANNLPGRRRGETVASCATQHVSLSSTEDETSSCADDGTSTLDGVTTTERSMSSGRRRGLASKHHSGITSVTTATNLNDTPTRPTIDLDGESDTDGRSSISFQLQHSRATNLQ